MSNKYTIVEYDLPHFRRKYHYGVRIDHMWPCVRSKINFPTNVTRNEHMRIVPHPIYRQQRLLLTNTTEDGC